MHACVYQTLRSANSSGVPGRPAPSPGLASLSESLAGFRDITGCLRDSNTDAFPRPEARQQRQTGGAAAAAAAGSTDLSKREVAIEKAIVTRKILKVSAWDRVVSRVVVWK